MGIRTNFYLVLIGVLNNCELLDFITIFELKYSNLIIENV